MFEVSFGELLVIFIVALVVLGPEKLPTVARTVGALIGRMQRFVSSVKSDIQREIDLEGIHSIRKDLQQAANSFREQVEQHTHEIQGTFEEVRHDLNQTVNNTKESMAFTLIDRELNEDEVSPVDSIEPIQTLQHPTLQPKTDDRQLSLIFEDNLPADQNHKES